jgi:hypothetical protein
MTKARRINIGSISTGTMRCEDLVPAFIAELRSQTPCKLEHRKLCTEIEHAMDADGYFESEDASNDLESLIDALQEYSPVYFYFGAHPGDGADFGYWLPEDFPLEFDGLKVSDLSEVPTGYTGEVLEINDHGNMALYAYSRGKRRELWAIV